MQKRTRSILDELDNLYTERDRNLVIESRARNAIASVINLLEQIDEAYSSEQAENLNRKLLNAIKNRDVNRFSRSVRKTHGDS